MNKSFSFGIKVKARTTAPIVISKELLDKFPSDPVWYRRLINPIAKSAYAPNL
jgi:hypothetical protein